MSTKAELEAINAQLVEQLSILGARHDALRAQHEALQAELTNVCDVASAVNKATARPAYVMPAWQVKRQQEMAAAKAAAMAHHCVVKV